MKMFMKAVKTIIIITFFGLTGSVCIAQKTGIKGGVNFSNLYEDKIDDKNMKIGINAGIYMRGKLGEKVSIQPEFLYSRKGAQLDYEDFMGTGKSGKYRYTLGYLEMPVLFVFHFNKINLQVGPYVGWLLHVHVKNVDDKGFIQELEELDRDDFNTLDLGPSIGLGLDFPSGILGVRYNMGLRGIGEDDEFGEIATQNSKNSVLQFYLGFSL
jgi:hypothetical protein